jgi:hypothetical protein
MGLQSHFQWFTQLDEKLISTHMPNLDYFSDAKNLYFYVAKGHLFSKHILFGNDSTRTEMHLILNTASTDLDEKSFSRRFSKRKASKPKMTAF